MSDPDSARSTPVQGNPPKSKRGPCPWLCNLVPANVPLPGPAQSVLHPRKDVFVLKDWMQKALNREDWKEKREAFARQWDDHGLKKRINKLLSSKAFVAKVGPTGDRRCKMELELVTPKGPDKKPPCRIDTRETQCDPDPPPCCCMRPKKKRKNHKD